MSAINVVEFAGVTKTFSVGTFRRSATQALNDVTFHLPPGEICGLVGPNRAGKTTLVKLLLGLSRPTMGHVSRFGASATVRHSLARVGYVHETQAFPRYLSARDLLLFHGALALLPEPYVKRRVPELLELVGLADRGGEAVSRFSKGMTQRLALALALLGECDLLVFDEPVEGLDQSGRLLLRRIISDQRAKGRTVLLVSHLLPEVERLCDRVLILSRGRLLYSGPVSALTHDDSQGPARSLELALQGLFEEPPTWTPPPSYSQPAG